MLLFIGGLLLVMLATVLVFCWALNDDDTEDPRTKYPWWDADD